MVIVIVAIDFSVLHNSCAYNVSFLYVLCSSGIRYLTSDSNWPNQRKISANCKREDDEPMVLIWLDKIC